MSDTPTGPDAELPEPDADVVAAAAGAAPAVARLSGGVFGEVATYLPGRRVTGVRVSAGRAEVYVVGRYGPSMDEIASQVRSAVRGALGFPARVDVYITDLVHPADALPPADHPADHSDVEPPPGVGAGGGL